jgi:hypothetical protein
MNSKNVFTVILSVLLSVAATLWLTRHHTQEAPPVPEAGVLQARSIQLIDDQHKVRGIIGFSQVSGHQQPQILLRGEDGQASVLLTLNERGEGTLYFNSKDKEGKVGLGYLWGSDIPSSGTEDPLGAWGLRVLGQNGQTTGVGIGNNGRLIAPVH